MHIAGVAEQKGYEAPRIILDPLKASWLSAIPQTISNAQAKVSHGGNIIYYRWYRQGVHRVVTEPRGRVIDQDIQTESSLITQYPIDAKKPVEGVLIGLQVGQPQGTAKGTISSLAQTSNANGDLSLSDGVANSKTTSPSDVNPSSILRSAASQISGIPDAGAAERLRNSIASSDAGGAWLTDLDPQTIGQRLAKNSDATPADTALLADAYDAALYRRARARQPRPQQLSLFAPPERHGQQHLFDPDTTLSYARDSITDPTANSVIGDAAAHRLWVEQNKLSAAKSTPTTPSHAPQQQTLFSAPSVSERSEQASHAAERDFTRAIFQKITSAKTSLAQNDPPLYRAPFFTSALKRGEPNFDIGAGKSEIPTRRLSERGVPNIPFDPFNRDTATNRAAIDSVVTGTRYNTVTAANVLNVIAEPESRANVILQAAKALKKNGTAYFQIYTSDKAGETKTGTHQNALKPEEYIPEIKRYFETVEKKANILIAKKPRQNVLENEKATWWDDSQQSVRALFSSAAHETRTPWDDVRTGTILSSAILSAPKTNSQLPTPPKGDYAAVVASVEKLIRGTVVTDPLGNAIRLDLPDNATNAKNSIRGRAIHFVTEQSDQKKLSPWKVKTVNALAETLQAPQLIGQSGNVFYYLKTYADGTRHAVIVRDKIVVAHEVFPAVITQYPYDFTDSTETYNGLKTRDATVIYKIGERVKTRPPSADPDNTSPAATRAANEDGRPAFRPTDNTHTAPTVNPISQRNPSANTVSGVPSPATHPTPPAPLRSSASHSAHEQYAAVVAQWTNPDGTRKPGLDESPQRQTHQPHRTPMGASAHTRLQKMVWRLESPRSAKLTISFRRKARYARNHQSKQRRQRT